MVITPPEFKEYLIIRYLGPGSDTSETFVSLITRITSDMYFHIFIIYFHLFSVIVLYISYYYSYYCVVGSSTVCEGSLMRVSLRLSSASN